MRTDEFQSFTSTESCNITALPAGSGGRASEESKAVLCFSWQRRNPTVAAAF